MTIKITLSTSIDNKINSDYHDKNTLYKYVVKFITIYNIKNIYHELNNFTKIEEE